MNRFLLAVWLILLLFVSLRGFILLFLADCIGSAFNMKGAMQCPNCRNVEKGQWLFANGSTRLYPEFVMEDWIPEEDLYGLSYPEMVRAQYFVLRSSFFS